MKLIDKIHKYKTMLSYCLKCRKNTGNINPKISRTSSVKQWYYEILVYVVVKNQNS